MFAPVSSADLDVDGCNVCPLFCFASMGQFWDSVVDGSQRYATLAEVY